MELPVIDFIRARIAEADSSFETRPGSVYYEMFIKPQQLMLQPLNNTLDQVLVSQSIRRILAQPSPDAYPEADVDDIVGNLYVFRDPGAFARTIVRVYYATPRDKEYTTLTAQFTSGTLSFFNESDIAITSNQMALQTDGTLYYVDVSARAQAEGSQFSVPAGSITGFLNDAEAIRVTNISDATGGLTRESNTQLLVRAQNSIGVRDLETTKGINAILREKFPFIRSLFPIGFGDPEMQRDIAYNTHIGGRTDIYIKTPSLTTASKDFAGIDYDFTRSIDRQLHIQMAKSAADAILPAYTGTPQILAGSVIVREDIVETSAILESFSVPPSTGINLTGKEWLKIQIDSYPAVLIKVSGAIPAQTQRFEIINSINAAVGRTVATASPGNKFRIISPTVGITSLIALLATSPNSQAGTAIFNASAFPYTILGVAAEKYSESSDYIVDYINGNIYQTAYPGSRYLPTILSGQTMLTSQADGSITQTGSSYFLESLIPSKFLTTNPAVKVRVGDEVTIELIGGLATGTVLGNLPQTFTVVSVPTTNRLSLEVFNPTGIAFNVTYSVKSNQVVIIDYKYNPLSIDIGGQVLLQDGLLRGVRTGRTAFTITDTPFIDIVSIQEIDPESREIIAAPLNPPHGFGYGGFGDGAFGVGAGGDYEFRVLAPRDRFSVFDDAVILFGQDALSKSYRVTYRHVPEIVAIHNVTRDDSERVTGADVLAKHYIPAFFDLVIGIVRDPTNLTTPSNSGLASLIADFVNTKPASLGVQASDISKLLEDQGVYLVHTPFDMSATVLNPDGTTTILESQDVLTFPDVILPKDTENFSTKRIVHFLPGAISVIEVK